MPTFCVQKEAENMREWQTDGKNYQTLLEKFV